jgi:renin receptor
LIIFKAAGTSTLEQVAIFYSDQYPAMFNLLFWTSLILAVALIGITYGMMNMDPGLDTVIYRMTSNRIKKDN